MTTTVRPFRDRDQWLFDRAANINSTDSAALFGLSPYKTEFELWHEKHSGLRVDRADNERTVWGARLQDAIAAGVAADRGWTIRRKDEYVFDQDARMGSSFDFEVVGEAMLMEVKNVDQSVFRETWIGHDGDTLEAPPHIEMQVQHQMEVADVRACAIVALVGGNEARVAIRDRDRTVGRMIRERVAAFWRSIAENRQPRPDYQRDAEFLTKLYGRADANVVIEADTETAELLDEYERLGAEIDKRAAIKARVLERIGRASRVLTPRGALSVGMVKASAGTEITQSMVGTRVGARDGFRMFRYTPKTTTKE
jgi:putative phage-type endonuclease